MDLTTLDVLEIIKAKKAGQAFKSNPNLPKPANLKAAIHSISDVRARDLVEAQITKELQSPDIAQLRLVSIFDKMAELRNEQTVFLNILEGNPTYKTRDLQTRFRERRIGNDTASFFNPNGTFAGEAYSNRPMRDNTVGFLGNKVKVRFLASALAEQSPVEAVDLMQEEIEWEITRIRRKLNSALLANTEVKAENTPNIPQWGGFITRSALYNTALTPGSDLTNPVIQGRVSAIANLASTEGLGYVPLIALCTEAQIAKVDDLMIARYPGENSASHLATVQMMMGRVQSLGIAPEQIVPYMPRPGRPILFIHEPMLPAGGYCLFFDPRQPQLGRFQMMGMPGPWAIERPTEDLTEIQYVFDSATLIDQLVESRAVVTGLN